MRSSQRPISQRLSRHSRRRRFVTLPAAARELDKAWSPEDNLSATSAPLHEVASQETETAAPALGTVATSKFPAKQCRVDQPVFLNNRPVPNIAVSKPAESASPSPRAASQAAWSVSDSIGINALRSWFHQPESRVWMFLGDETTAWMRFCGQPGYTDLFRHRLRWELKRSADLVVNTGVAEATLEQMTKLATQGIRQCGADAVFVMPGQSDAARFVQSPQQFAQHLHQLAEQIREHGAIPVFQTPPLPAAGLTHQQRQKLSHLADFIRDMSVTEDVPLIDHAEFWLERAAGQNWADPSSGHLTAAGQSALALVFLSELDLYDRSSKLCHRLEADWQKSCDTKQISDSAPTKPVHT